ncbi:13048_t:CDS:1, partial [Dentiscutata erythropus]
MNCQECKSTKSTPYQLVFRQDPQSELPMISMLYQQNIIHEDDIPLENQSTSINYTLQLNSVN